MRGALRGMNLGRLDLLSDRARVITTHHGHYGSSGARARRGCTISMKRVGPSSGAIARATCATSKRNTSGSACHRHVSWELRDSPRSLSTTAVLLPCTNPVGRGEDSLASALTVTAIPMPSRWSCPKRSGTCRKLARKRSDKAQTGVHAALQSVSARIRAAPVWSVQGGRSRAAHGLPGGDVARLRRR